MSTLKPIDKEITDKAYGLYGTLVGLTVSPREAQQILLIMHLTLWLNCKSGDASVDTMLKEYAGSFTDNLRLHGEVEDLEQ
jgi:hypothetical protein